MTMSGDTLKGIIVKIVSAEMISKALSASAMWYFFIFIPSFENDF